MKHFFCPLIRQSHEESKINRKIRDGMEVCSPKMLTIGLKFLGLEFFTRHRLFVLDGGNKLKKKKKKFYTNPITFVNRL